VTTGTVRTAADAFNRGAKLPVPWWHAWRLLDKVGATTPKAPVVFECVGVPGMLEEVLAGAPLYSRVGLDGVDAAFDALADPEAHAKILIDPGSSGIGLVQM